MFQKAVRNGCFRRFRRIALAPVPGGKAPAGLKSALRKLRLHFELADAAHAEALAGVFQFDRVEAEADVIYAGSGQIHALVRLLTGAAEGKEFHDFAVGIDFKKQVPVALFPVAQNEAGRFNADHAANSDFR